MKKKIFLASLLISMLLIVALCVSPHFTLMYFVWGASDEYGNDINYVEIWQWNGTVYILRKNFTSSGGKARVNDNQTIKFIVNIKFNDTLASNNSEAISYTRVYMNISQSIWTNKELNNTACSSSGGFYWLKEEGLWNQTGYPQAGITYECSVLYQGYY